MPSPRVTRTDELDAQLARYPSARAWSPDGRPAGLPDDRWSDGGLEALATLDGVDLVVVATTGMAALPAVLAALDARRPVALANKETLVTGGHLVAAALDRLDGDRLGWLRPVDSEHSAIWQCLVGERIEDVARLVLTASGGPFRGRGGQRDRLGDAGGGARAPDVAHGSKGDDRLRHAREQGVRGDRGQMAVRAARTLESRQ